MKCCGSCVCASFKPEQVNGCLAPMPIGDSRRSRRVTPETECFTGQWTENKASKLKGQIAIGKMKDALKREP